MLTRKEISQHLDDAIQEIEISPSNLEKAHQRYQSVGRWLCREESSLKNFSPNIYPQGSFNLGTAVKPISLDDDYDVDSVCEIQASRTSNSQETIKKAVGKELKEYAKSQNFSSPLEEGKRCWTLVYSDGHGFHFDVLPSLPLNSGISTDISITDKTHPRYKQICDDWEQSNPKGYLEWFKSRMTVTYREAVLASLGVTEAAQASVDEVPVYRIKTPLQKAIMLLKRHRDLFFLEKESGHKPISVIVTTLAAMAYENEPDLLLALTNIINKLPNLSQHKHQGRYWLPNPSNPNENFAERWNQNPELAKEFSEWVSALKEDIEWVLNASHLNELSIGLLYFIGERSHNKLFKPNELVKDGFFNKGWRRSRTEPESTGIKTINITAKFSKNGFRQKQFNSGYLLDKGVDLTFTANEKFPGAIYYWQVVNTGPEAGNSNSLRGGFYDGSSRRGRVRNEKTKFTGLHMVQCFAIKNGYIVGRSKEFVVSIK